MTARLPETADKVGSLNQIKTLGGVKHDKKRLYKDCKRIEDC